MSVETAIQPVPAGTYSERIGLLMAMDSEARILADIMGLHYQEPTDGKPFGYFTDPSGRILVVTCGLDSAFQVDRVGKASISAAAQELLDNNASTIINAGTAGGLGDVGIGTIVQGTAVTNHDIDIPLPGYTEYARRQLPLATITGLQVQDIQIVDGVISTGEALTFSAEHLAAMTESHALAKDMEGAAAAEFLRLRGFDVSGRLHMIKSITDIVLDSQPEQFMENFSLAIGNLGVVIPEVITHLRQAR